jgi:hypothetical protein
LLTAPPFGPADSPRELHHTQSPGKQQISLYLNQDNKGCATEEILILYSSLTFRLIFDIIACSVYLEANFGRLEYTRKSVTISV